MSQRAPAENQINIDSPWYVKGFATYEFDHFGRVKHITSRQNKRVNDKNNNNLEENVRSKCSRNNFRRHAISFFQTFQKLPATPHAVATAFNDRLLNYELTEILKHNEVYYIGDGILHKPTIYENFTTTVNNVEYKNYGFDDPSGSYLPVSHDHIAYRYEILRVIGKGTFGMVLQVYDHKTNTDVALKIVRNQERFHVQAVQEIEILSLLKQKDVDNKLNVVHMYDNFIFRNHPCITFELLSLNLYELTRKYNFKGLEISLIRRFAYAILKCLEALCELKIIHCDLKPENVLLKQVNRSGIKVVDFGSSCFVDNRVHNYIQSRFYRSPEVILGVSYGTPIDMWSFGCILAELFQGKPIFTGEDEKDQMACIMEALGKPPNSLIGRAQPKKRVKFFDENLNPTYCEQVSRFGKVRLYPGKSKKGITRNLPGTVTLLPVCQDQDFKDFVVSCLEWDPNDRMTPKSALSHVWMTRSPRLVQKNQE